MAKEGKTGHKRKRRNSYQVDKFVSDDSDEDYKIDEDEVLDESEDDYVSSLADDESEESLGEFEEEEEWIDENVRKVRMPRGRKEIQSREKNVSVKLIKNKMLTDCFSISKGPKSTVAEEKANACSIDLLREERGEVTYRKPRNKSRVKKRRYGLPCIRNAGEEEMAEKLEEEEEEYDDADDDDSDDEDFIPSEDMEAIIEEPEKKQGPRKNRSTSVRKLSHRKRTNLQTKKDMDSSCSSDSNVSSDSDFEFQGTMDDDDDNNDDDYTVSEEESELIREANKICARPTAGLRSSTLLETIQEEEWPLKGKDHGRKGKQKVNDMEVQVGKQVCGICLSEEGKRKAVGVLNCCTHYFCFTCIIEWSKVESRCPVCKQRFATIRRTMRSDAIHDVRDAIFPVPERDQVYQPSEEELRGYLDPYENVLCTECHQGGDDALVLLCDLCDSSTHTYCAGLQEVPDGNWYCNGCRPTALALENGTSNNHIHSTPVGSQPANPVHEWFDLNKEYVPDTPPNPSPRRSTLQTGAISPTSGSTLSHRWIYRQVWEIMNFGNRQMGVNDGSNAVPGTGINLLGPLISSPSTAPNRDVFSSSIRGQALRGQSSATSSSHGVAASGINGHIGEIYLGSRIPPVP